MTDTDSPDVTDASCIGPIARITILGSATLPPASSSELAAVDVTVSTNSGSTRNGSPSSPVGALRLPSVLGGSVPRPGTTVSIAAPPGRRYFASNASHASAGVVPSDQSPNEIVTLVT